MYIINPAACDRQEVAPGAEIKTSGRGLFEVL